MKQKCFLGHHANRIRQRVEAQVAQVIAVKADAAGCRVVQARHKVGQRCFASAAWPHNCGQLAGLNRKTDFVQRISAVGDNGVIRCIRISVAPMALLWLQACTNLCRVAAIGSRLLPIRRRRCLIAKTDGCKLHSPMWAR